MHEEISEDFEKIEKLMKKFDGEIKIVILENQEVIIVDLIKEL